MVFNKEPATSTCAQVDVDVDESNQQICKQKINKDGVFRRETIWKDDCSDIIFILNQTQTAPFRMLQDCVVNFIIIHGWVAPKICNGKPTLINCVGNKECHPVDPKATLKAKCNEGTTCTM